MTSGMFIKSANTEGDGRSQRHPGPTGVQYHVMRLSVISKLKCYDQDFHGRDRNGGKKNYIGGELTVYGKSVVTLQGFESHGSSGVFKKKIINKINFLSIVCM